MPSWEACQEDPRSQDTTEAYRSMPCLTQYQHQPRLPASPPHNNPLDNNLSYRSTHVFATRSTRRTGTTDARTVTSPSAATWFSTSTTSSPRAKSTQRSLSSTRVPLTRGDATTSPSTKGPSSAALTQWKTSSKPPTSTSVTRDSKNALAKQSSRRCPTEARQSSRSSSALMNSSSLPKM